MQQEDLSLGKQAAEPSLLHRKVKDMPARIHLIATVSMLGCSMNTESSLSDSRQSADDVSKCLASHKHALYWSRIPRQIDQNWFGQQHCLIHMQMEPSGPDDMIVVSQD